MNVVWIECGLKQMWSQMYRSQMDVVSNEQVSNVEVSNERGLKWIGLNFLHTTHIMLGGLTLRLLPIGRKANHVLFVLELKCNILYLAWVYDCKTCAL